MEQITKPIGRFHALSGQAKKTWGVLLVVAKDRLELLIPGTLAEIHRFAGEGMDDKVQIVRLGELVTVTDHEIPTHVRAVFTIMAAEVTPLTKSQKAAAAKVAKTRQARLEAEIAQAF